MIPLLYGLMDQSRSRHFLELVSTLGVGTAAYLLSWISPLAFGIGYWKRKEIGTKALYQALLSCILTYGSVFAVATVFTYKFMTAKGF